jgi:5'-3' exonuclease
MNQRILILDLASCLHTLKYSIGKNKISSREKNTFIIYGFLFKLNALRHKTKSDIVVYALDSKTSLRRKLYADYKKKRREDKTAKQIELDNLAFPQFQEIIDYVLPTLGCMNVFGEEGFESDEFLLS